MVEKIRKYQSLIFVGLIVICIGIVFAGGIRYLWKLQNNLTENAIQDVMNVTLQQKQALESFISEDREQLHSYVEYFSQNDHSGPEEVQRLLTLLGGSDAACVVICFDEGWACSSMHDEVLQMDEEQLNTYKSLPDSGIRDNFIGMFSGVPKFSYYEKFTFSNGHSGLIEKGYDRSRIPETFRLSVYDGQGYGYVLNRNGDVLLRSDRVENDPLYENIFDTLNDTGARQKDSEILSAAMEEKETGSFIFDGNDGKFVYTYTPVDSVDDWYLLSVVPAEAIREAADQALRDTRMAFMFFILVLIICIIFTLMIRHTHKDIKSKEQEIRYQTQLFNIFTTYLANNTDDMYMMYDHETEELEYVSPNVERVLGVKKEELVDYFWKSDLGADPEATKVYYAEVQALSAGETARIRYTERLNPKTGELKYFQESAYCADIQGHSKRVAYLSDRTRERKDKNNLSDALRMAQAANDAKSAFLGNVSHDIRTPMNAIIGFLTLMRDEADNPGIVREYTQRIEAASQHLLGLINDVLDMNKIESGSATLNISEMDLAEIIDEINAIIRPQTKAKNQTFDITVPCLVYEHLLGDKLRINQILINLLSNAVKYTPEGGTIAMRMEEMPQVVNNYSRVRFTVSDTGLGMSEDYLKVIFDPFTREETEVTHEIQGTGLGMAITKSLVDLMGGSIHVESEQGKGSTFVVELELRIQEQEDDPKFWDNHNVARMIVADDDEEVCRYIVEAMLKAGVTADYTTDGKNVVPMMRSAREAGHPYDLILLDWKMPDLNGLETARLIRKNYPDRIPILLLTAYDWSEIEQEAVEIGVDHFMPKPFFMSTFKDAIRRVMGNMKKAENSQSDVVRGRHILMVDDIEVNRIVLEKILNGLGAVCDVAGNGQEAVEKFEASEPGEYDLILMDVQMPVMNGYTATRTIRSSAHPSAKTIPIIAMTANAFVDDVRDAIESGMDAHIAKPVQIEKLKETIRQVFDSRAEKTDTTEL